MRGVRLEFRDVESRHRFRRDIQQSELSPLHPRKASVNLELEAAWISGLIDGPVLKIPREGAIGADLSGRIPPRHPCRYNPCASRSEPAELGERLSMQNDRKEIKMYSDFKSPYAFLAFDPCVYRKLKHARSDGEARRGSYMT